jgi:hypothetical protein
MIPHFRVDKFEHNFHWAIFEFLFSKWLYIYGNISNLNKHGTEMKSAFPMGVAFAVRVSITEQFPTRCDEQWCNNCAALRSATQWRLSLSLCISFCCTAEIVMQIKHSDVLMI